MGIKGWVSKRLSKQSNRGGDGGTVPVWEESLLFLRDDCIEVGE